MSASGMSDTKLSAKTVVAPQPAYPAHTAGGTNTNSTFIQDPRMRPLAACQSPPGVWTWKAERQVMGGCR
eukprot:88946-Chlamydomonas_euryale.AAC.1